MNGCITYDNDNAVSITTIGCQVDKIIELLSKNKCKNRQLGIIFDLFNRIKCNLVAIAMLDDDWATTPRNILYRSVISDMMIAMYHLLATDEESAYCIEVDNCKHARSVYQFLNLHCRLALDYYNHSGTPINQTEQELVNRYKKYFNDYIRDENGKWEFVKPAKSVQSSYKGTIQSIANYLEGKKDIIDFIPYLNMCYKELSQTEHYSEKGRLFAFYTSEDFYKFHKVILHGVMCSTNLYIISSSQTPIS